MENNSNALPTLSLECFGIHVHFPDCQPGQNENVFIGALNAKSADDPILDDLKKAIIKHFPEIKEKIEVIQYKNLDNGKKRVLFCDGFLLDEPNYPIVSEKKQKIYMKPTAEIA